MRWNYFSTFPNFNGATVEVWEWIRNFIPHFTGHVINYVCKRVRRCFILLCTYRLVISVCFTVHVDSLCAKDVISVCVLRDDACIILLQHMVPSMPQPKVWYIHCYRTGFTAVLCTAIYITKSYKNARDGWQGTWFDVFHNFSAN